MLAHFFHIPLTVRLARRPYDVPSGQIPQTPELMPVSIYAYMVQSAAQNADAQV